MNIPNDLYVLKSDLDKAAEGTEVFGFSHVDNTEDYELISKYAFIPLAVRVKENQYSVCFIMK